MQVRYDRETEDVPTSNTPNGVGGFAMFFAIIFTLLWAGALTGAVVWLNIFFWGEIFG